MHPYTYIHTCMHACMHACTATARCTWWRWRPWSWRRGRWTWTETWWRFGLGAFWGGGVVWWGRGGGGYGSKGTNRFRGGSWGKCNILGSANASRCSSEMSVLDWVTFRVFDVVLLWCCNQGRIEGNFALGPLHFFRVTVLTPAGLSKATFKTVSWPDLCFLALSCNQVASFFVRLLQQQPRKKMFDAYSLTSACWPPRATC